MRKITWPALLALLLVFSLALAACTAGGATTDTPAATDEPAVEEPVEEATGGRGTGRCRGTGHR